jgi:hypothetical protein
MVQNGDGGTPSPRSPKISCQGDVAIERERVALGRADHAPVLGPVDKGVAAVGRGRYRVRGACRKCPTAADCAVGTGRAPDRNRVFLGVDVQCRDAARVPLVVGRVVEIDAVDVGGGREFVCARLEFIVKATVFADVVTVPEFDEAVSQVGEVIE